MYLSFLTTTGTLSFPPNTTILYLMISCEGELRNGTKYAELEETRKHVFRGKGGRGSRDNNFDVFENLIKFRWKFVKL